MEKILQVWVSSDTQLSTRLEREVLFYYFHTIENDEFDLGITTEAVEYPILYEGHPNITSLVEALFKEITENNITEKIEFVLETGKDSPVVDFSDLSFSREKDLTKEEREEFIQQLKIQMEKLERKRKNIP